MTDFLEDQLKMSKTFVITSLITRI